MFVKSLGPFRAQFRPSVIDAAIVVLSPFFAFFIRDALPNGEHQFIPFWVYSSASSVSGLLMVFYVRLARPNATHLASVDIAKIFKIAIVSSFTGVAATFFVAKSVPISRYIPIIDFLLIIGLCLLWRAILIYSAQRKLSRVSSVGAAAAADENCLVIGLSPSAEHFVGMMEGLTAGSMKILGFVSIDGGSVGSVAMGRTIFGPVEKFDGIISEFKNHGIQVKSVVISHVAPDLLERVGRAIGPTCALQDIRILKLSDLIADWYFLGSSGGVPRRESPAYAPSDAATSAPANPINRYLRARQFVDRAFAWALISVLAPLIAIIAVMVWFDVGRPVQFWQQRAGRDGRFVVVHKFRTLSSPTESASARERVPSRVGRFLQVTHLDEIPQLFDIARGDLAFIGPRPLLAAELPPDVYLRNRVLPGLTGWAQVHGGKSVSIDEKIALDNWYVIHASVRIDAIILLKTIRILFRGREWRDEDVIAGALREFGQLRNRG